MMSADRPRTVERYSAKKWRSSTSEFPAPDSVDDSNFYGDEFGGGGHRVIKKSKTISVFDFSERETQALRKHVYMNLSAKNLLPNNNLLVKKSALKKLKNLI